MKVLTSSGEITVQELKNAFDIIYSQQANLKVKEQDIIYNFYNLLEDIEAENHVPISYYNPLDDQMVTQDINLKDILGYLTGSVEAKVIKLK